MDDLMNHWIDDEWDEYAEINFEDFYNRVIRKQRIFHLPRLGPLKYYSDETLVSRFRVNKVVLLEIHELSRDRLQHETHRNYALPPLVQMLVALRYYATGDHFDTIGDGFRVHKSTVSRCVGRVTEALMEHLHKYVRLPSGDEIDDIQAEFYEKSNRTLPRVLGAIDGTLIHITRPAGEADAPYICRKGYPGLNVFAFCDDRRRFRYILAKFPGSCHDAAILKNTKFFNMFESGVFGNAMVLADSGYGIRDWLLTPVTHASTPEEEEFNTVHVLTRLIIEQAFGILKRRFAVLANTMRLKPEKACQVISVCTMLHNIAIDKGLENFENTDPDAQSGGDQPIHAGPMNNQSVSERLRVAAAQRNRNIYIQRNITHRRRNR